MFIRLDLPFLERHCAVAPEALTFPGAARIVQALGWLAPWWLAPEVLRRAADHQPAYRRYTYQPALPSGPGGCWVIFIRPEALLSGQESAARQVRGQALLSLRPAFLLPLCWQAGVEDDPRLPVPLRELVDKVRGQAPGKERGRWGLRLAATDDEEARDLSGLDGKAMGVESGWAALLGALRLAQDDGTPDGTVWASAAWHDEFGVGEVQGLKEKLKLAAEWKATRVFVPAQNQRDVFEWREAGGQLEVDFLAPVSRSPDPARLLEPYLDRLGTEPERNAPFEQRRRFYARVNRRRAAEFHWTHLLEDVIAHCRERVRADHPRCRPTHLATVVGHEPSVVVQAPAALDVRCCLLLHEEPPDEKDWKEKRYQGIRTNRDRILEALKNRGIEVTPLGVRLGDRKEELSQLQAALRDFAANVAVEQLAFDLTPGYKSLSLELEELARAGSWLLYCRHQQLEPDNRVDPGTERYDCWRSARPPGR